MWRLLCGLKDNSLFSWCRVQGGVPVISCFLLEQRGQCFMSSETSVSFSSILGEFPVHTQ